LYVLIVEEICTFCSNDDSEYQKHRQLLLMPNGTTKRFSKNRS